MGIRFHHFGVIVFLNALFFQVGDKTQPGLTHCKCNHLTSFASDFVVAPNPIDFDKVFSADLSKNFVVLLVVCLLFGLYFVLVVIARRYDKMDLEKVKVFVAFPVLQTRGVEYWERDSEKSDLDSGFKKLVTP